MNYSVFFQGCTVYNDSKEATNSAAMIAALETLCQLGRTSIILLAGGVFKEEAVANIARPSCCMC